MKNMSDEELVDIIDSFGFDKDTYVRLKARLERGRKAIEAMEKIAKARLEDDYDEFAADVDLILRKYQQFCKEAADEN